MESLPNPAPALVPVNLPLGINLPSRVYLVPSCIFPRAQNHRCHFGLSGHKIGGQRLLGLLKIAIEGKIESETPRVITL